MPASFAFTHKTTTMTIMLTHGSQVRRTHFNFSPVAHLLSKLLQLLQPGDFPYSPLWFLFKRVCTIFRLRTPNSLCPSALPSKCLSKCPPTLIRSEPASPCLQVYMIDCIQTNFAASHRFCICSFPNHKSWFFHFFLRLFLHTDCQCS